MKRPSRSQTFLGPARAARPAGVFVVGQQAILHPAGDSGEDTHVEQIEHLLDVIDTHPQIQVLVLPFGTIPPAFATHLFMWTFGDNRSGDTENGAAPACA
jgi:hypothetical protein